MKTLTKIITAFTVFTIVLGLTGGIASAQSLGERNERAKAEYREAQGQFQREVGFYQDFRQNYLNAKEKFQQVPNVQNREALDDAAKAYLEQAVITLIARLESIKAWVSNRQTLSEADRQAIIAEIDEDLNWLNERLPKIQSATPSQVKEAAAEVRTYWEVHRARVKSIIGQILAARVDFVIVQTESFSVEVTDSIDELKADGKDTTQLEAWLVDFNEDIALAKEKNELGRAKFKAIKGEPGFDPAQELYEVNQLFEKGNELIREANQHLLDAHALLGQIVREIKNMGAIPPDPPVSE